jgi:hypothetical protein
MVRTRHLTCFWLFMVPNDAPLYRHLLSNIVRHDLSFTSIRGFSDIVVLGNDGTYRALHLLFVLIYCVSNDPLFMRLLSNIVRHEHSSIGGYSVLTGVVSTTYFVIHKKKSLYSFNHQFTRQITTLNHLIRQGTFINVYRNVGFVATTMKYDDIISFYLYFRNVN